MSVMEQQTLDMSKLLIEAYELSDMINNSAVVADYLYWKQVVEEDEQIQAAVRQFERAKLAFEEAERFGHYHPNYHEAMEMAYAKEKELESIEAVKCFKKVEEALDTLLYDISKTLAHAVSESIKVPSNNLIPESSGCGSGGSCNGACS